MEDLNPYTELGVARDAAEWEVRKAYRVRAKRAHPDRGGDPNEWGRVCTSLAVLTDPKKRKTFDDTGRIEEDRPDNDRALALQIIESHMGQIVNAFISSAFDPGKDPRNADMIAAIKGAIMVEIAQANDGIEGGEKVVAFMADLMGRFHLKEDTAASEDPIRRGLDRQIKSAEQQLSDIRSSIRVRELALTLVDGYRFEKFEATPSPYAGRWDFEIGRFCPAGT